MSSETTAPATDPDDGADTWPRALLVISRGLALVSGALITGLMLLTTIDVVKRKFAGAGIDGTVEYSQVLLVLTVYTGMMSAEVTGTHIRTAVLVERLSSVRAAALRTIGLVAVSALVLWATVETAQQGWESFQVREFSYGITRVPVWPARVAIPIGLTGLLLALLFRSFEACKAVARELVIQRTARAGAHPPANSGKAADSDI
jgi:TRAP-type C4-dicarboxylate transport system permease small subunit